jgi:Flp pilus assembly pilin Flp
MPNLVKSLYYRILACANTDDGQGLTEYALILALIAIVAILGLHLLGGKVDDVLSTAGSSIQT